MANQLEVRMGANAVGTLVRTRRGARFAYNTEAQELYAGRPLLSCSLPVKSRPYAEGLTGTWFRGLLPEGERLDRISKIVGCDSSDYFALLEHIGWECAGAVCICEQGWLQSNEEPSHTLCSQQLARLLCNLPSYAGSYATARVSLGGYQEKMVVIARNIQQSDGRIASAEWLEPSPQSISTHIIKPQPTLRLPHIVEAEAWAMRTASFVARCSTCHLLELEGAPPSLLVERFDRERVNGRVVRLHQEDCCQALGISPHDKYASTDLPRGSDPSYKKIANLLSLYAADGNGELSELFRQMTVNVALGNVDAHAKNYAFVYHSLCVPSLSPMYDVVPVADIEPRAVHLSLAINGKMLARDVRRTDLVEEATSWGLTKSQAVALLDETLSRLDEGMAAAKEWYPEAAKRHEDATRRRIERLLRLA